MKIVSLSPKRELAWHLAEARINTWEGSVRSGKTIDSLLAWCEFVRTSGPGNLLMTGRTERTLKRNIVDVLVEMFGRRNARHIQGAGELHLFGRRIYLVGANNEEARSKIQGLTLVGAYLDEATTVPESFFTMLLSRLSLPGARLFCTMNPDSPMHWLKRSYLDRARLHLTGDGTVVNHDDNVLDLARFSYRIHDNETLPAEYVAALEAEYTGLWRRRFILGEWVAAEGSIYDMLDTTVGGPHVTAKLPEALEHRMLAIDYGTSNPFHALLGAIALDEEGRERLYIAREWRWDSSERRRQLTDGEYSTELLRWLQQGASGLAPYPVTVSGMTIDPSAASMRLQLQRDGWGWATPADNAVVDGIRSVATLLAAHRLVIHESCQHLLRELSGYVWDPKAQEKGDDAPVKQADHGPDALRYLVMHTRRYWRHWTVAPVADEEEEAAA